MHVNLVRSSREDFVPTLTHRNVKSVVNVHRPVLARHPVITTRLESRNTLGEDERLAREVPRNILRPLMMIIESDDIDGSTLEEMILRIRLVASGCYRTGAPRIILLHDICQMTGEKRVHAQLIAMCQGRGNGWRTLDA